MNIPYPNTDIIPITIYLEEGIDENGEAEVTDVITTKCTLNEKTKYIRDPDGQLISLESVVYMKGDISPSKDLKGTVVIEGLVRPYKIYRSSRPRDMYGRVHHTKLELI